MAATPGCGKWFKDTDQSDVFCSEKTKLCAWCEELKFQLQWNDWLWRHGYDDSSAMLHDEYLFGVGHEAQNNTDEWLKELFKSKQPPPSKEELQQVFKGFFDQLRDKKSSERKF